MDQHTKLVKFVRSPEHTGMCTQYKYDLHENTNICPSTTRCGQAEGGNEGNIKGPDRNAGLRQNTKTGRFL